MNRRTTSGTIVFTDGLGIRYSICRVDYTVYDDGTFEYVFTPDYRIIDILPEEFQGIPGLELSLRKESYVRRNIVPVFISERTPGEHREDKWELLEEVGMTYLDPVEWLLRTDRRYFGDPMTMERISEDNDSIVFDGEHMKVPGLAKRILSAIGTGRDVVIDGMKVDDGNRGTVCRLLRTLLNAERSKKTKDGRGRKEIAVDHLDMLDAMDDVSCGRRTADEAAKELGISRATFFRRMKQYRKEEKEGK